MTRLPAFFNSPTRSKVLDDSTYVYKRADGVEVVYKDGSPVFDPHMRQEVKIPDMKGDYVHDYKAANERAPKGPIEDGNTWHHHQDRQRMQEVPSDIHGDFTHKGGASGTRTAKGVKRKRG